MASRDAGRSPFVCMEDQRNERVGSEDKRKTALISMTLLGRWNDCTQRCVRG